MSEPMRTLPDQTLRRRAWAAAALLCTVWQKESSSRLVLYAGSNGVSHSSQRIPAAFAAYTNPKGGLPDE